MRDHEYSVVGHSRTSVGRYLGSVAAIIVSLISAAGIGLSNLPVAADLPSWLQPVLSVTISAGVTYWIVHFLFNRFGWRALVWFSQIPDINGRWNCEGTTLNADGETLYQWSSTITISQNWERIRVNQKSLRSSSNSMTAALVPEPDGSWTLFYSYRNDPKAGEPELSTHSGYAELQFPPDLRSAEGEYFNGKGRGTFGRMALTRA